MSRTTLCVLTAVVLAALAVGVMLTRQQVLGHEIKVPSGPGTYKVTLVVRGRSAGDAKLVTACPLDFNRQHVFREHHDSTELTGRTVELREGQRRQIHWTPRPGVAKGPFQARYEFVCRVDIPRPTTPMARLTQTLYAAPDKSDYVRSEPHIDPNDADICDLALELTGGLQRPTDQVRAIFRYVDEEIANEPAAGGPSAGAVECLRAGRADARGQSRLLVALCRSRGIPARLVTGVSLGRRGEQKGPHTWAEAWIGDYWLPMCPFHHHCGRVPATYLVFGFGDLSIVRGSHVRGLDHAFLVEHHAPPADAVAEGGLLRRLLLQLSLYALPPAEQPLVEFLLLLPLAALVVCVFRNLIGVRTFGTFAPALIGLAFRELRSLPGILVFVSIVLVGWGLRRVLDRYHLLQVPRTALLLSLVVILLLLGVLVANFQDVAFTRYFSLFPMVILTGMIERFWTLEAEDGAAASFKTLLGTILVAGTISLLLSFHAVATHMFRYPETLGLIMAGQLLIGRYTGYRLSELLRFRDLVKQPPAGPTPWALKS